MNAAFHRQTSQRRRRTPTRVGPEPAPPGTYHVVYEEIPINLVTKDPAGVGETNALAFAEWWAPPGVEIEDLGPSSDTEPGQRMYGYRVGDPNLPRIVAAGPHGNEWEIYIALGIMGRYWDAPDGPNAAVWQALRDTFCLYIIPVGNPYGFRNYTRRNGHNVDMQRNYDPAAGQWYSDDPYMTYQGPYPFSEPETQVIRDLIWREEPVVFIDCHTNSVKGGIEVGFSHGPDTYKDLARRTLNRVVEVMPNVPMRTWNIFRLPIAAAWAAEQLCQHPAHPLGPGPQTCYAQLLEGCRPESSIADGTAWKVRAESSLAGLLLICCEWLRFWETGVQ